MVVMGKGTADRRRKEAPPERADEPRYRPIANGTTSREPHFERALARQGRGRTFQQMG